MHNNLPVTNQEQSAGIEQVNQTTTQMDDITQQNAALVEQAAASAESLKTQAINLSELVDAFTLVKTRGAPAMARPVTAEIRAYKAAKNKLSGQITQTLIPNRN